MSGVGSDCRVYWGSHGCEFERGHAGHHRCECWNDRCEPDDPDICDHCREGIHPCEYIVGEFPYYGPDTSFYGEDVPAVPYP